jgi:hypothetical protein
MTPRLQSDVYAKATVPAYVEDGTVIGESSVVTELLEERYANVL